MSYRTLILGLPRSMTYWTAVTLGFDHDVSAWPVEAPKPGLCDTGFILLPPEGRQKYFDTETKFVWLRRPEAEVLASITRNFPTAAPSSSVAAALAHTNTQLKAFFASRPCLELLAPLSPHGLFRLAAYLGRESEHPQWVRALQVRRDRLDDPAIRASLPTLNPQP